MNSLISAIKAFVLKSRPAYKDDLGNGKYDIKKLPEECIPDSVNNKIGRAQRKADSAYNETRRAMNLANEARSTANTAKSTANTAKSTADAAQSTADAAQSTADAAQSTATEITNVVQPADAYNNGIKIKTYIGFTNVLGQYSSPATQSDINGRLYLRKSSDQTGVNLVIDNGTSTGTYENGASIGSDGLMLSKNSKIYAPVTPSNYGPIISIYNDADRAYVEFTKDACLVLPSSTPKSTKKFKITVDDTGTISATEVT